MNYPLRSNPPFPYSLSRNLAIFLPRSRVSRSHNASAKCTDSFMEEHPWGQTPEAQTDDNEKKKKLIDCAQ